jgi:cytoskeletal protein RodZ
MDNRFTQDEDTYHEVNYPPPRPSAEKISRLLPPRRRRRWPLIVGIVVILAAIGGAGAYVLQHKKHPAAPQPASNTNTTSSQATSQKLVAAVPTETYSSPTLNVTVRYPKSWSASEANSKITVASPTVLLPDASGQQTGGQVVLVIQPKQTSLPAFSGGNAQAVRDSEKLTYTNPSSMQRGQTYLSFLHYATSTAPSSGIDGLYVTGDAGYLAQQYIPKADILKGDPLVSVTFNKCTDTTCSNPTSLSVASTAWDDPNFSGAIRPILTSLVVN